MENPDSISKLVLRKGLDAGTAFEILSIDIADIDIGKNIGAALQIDQANADKNIAQAYITWMTNNSALKDDLCSYLPSLDTYMRAGYIGVVLAPPTALYINMFSQRRQWFT